MKNSCLSILLFAILLLPCKISATIYRVGSAWGTQANYQTLSAFILADTGQTSLYEIWLGTGTHEIDETGVVAAWQSGYCGKKTTNNKEI